MPFGIPSGTPSISTSATSDARTSANGNKQATGDVPYDLTYGAGSRGFVNNVAFPGSQVLGSQDSSVNTLKPKTWIWVLIGGFAVILFIRFLRH
jgi:hypothetical protein